MEQKNLSINKLSSELGINRASLTSIANNESKMIQLNTLEKICKYFDCTPNDLIQFLPEYTFSIDLNPYYEKNGYKSFYVDLQQSEIMFDVVNENTGMTNALFHSLTLGYFTDRNKNNNQMVLNVGLPNMIYEETPSRYGKNGYDTLENTSRILNAMSTNDLRELAKNMGEFTLNRNSDFKLNNFKQILIIFNTNNSKHNIIPTFTFNIIKNKELFLLE